MTKQDRRGRDSPVDHMPPSRRAALARLAQLVSAGASPPRVIAGTYAVLAEFQAESCAEDLDALRSEIDDAVTAAEDYAGEADAAAKPPLIAQLRALQAVQQTLRLEAERAQSDERPLIANVFAAAA